MTSWRPTSERVRGTYLGGRDVPAIMGLDPWSSAGDVYAKMVSGHEVKQNRRMAAGLWHEASMAEHVRVTIGGDVTRDCFYLEERNPFGCSVDCIVGDVLHPEVLDSFKVTRSLTKGPEWEEKWGTEGTDEVDPAAAGQAQWEMMLTGARSVRIWLLDLDVDDEPRRFLVRRDNTKIAAMREAADAFLHDCVYPRIPPKVAPISDDAARSMWPDSVKGKLLTDVPDAFVVAAMQFLVARDMEKMAVAQKKAAGVVLKHAMGTAEEARWPADGMRPKGSVFFKATQINEPTTDHEGVAYELAKITNTSGATFKALLDKHTRKPWTDRFIRVHISTPKPKATP